MNIYKQLDQLLKEQDSSCQELLEELIKEIKELKLLLKKQDKSQYYKFINNLRKRLKADIEKGIYPEIIYNNKKYGIDNRGYLYDKQSTRTLKAYEAYEIYKYLYNNRKNIEKLIKN